MSLTPEQRRKVTEIRDYVLDEALREIDRPILTPICRREQRANLAALNELLRIVKTFQSFDDGNDVDTSIELPTFENPGETFRVRLN